jgi:mono/diheme cytochrome c family protein
VSNSLKLWTAGLVLAFGWNLQAAWVHDARAAAARVQAAQPQAASAAASRQAESSEAGAVLTRYCSGCHNERLKTAGLTLDTMSVNDVGRDAPAWEKVVRKLRARTMPPSGVRRPDAAGYTAVIASLETALDRAAADRPNPGRTTAHRLNRTEYANAIRDLLALDVDVEALLPPDDADLGFDNMADILSFSPALLERYMSAGRKISRLAVGDPTPGLVADTYDVPRMRFQDDRMDEALPFGSRGGVAIRHHFPLDAEYEVKIRLRRQLYDYIRGLQKPQQLEVRLNGQRVTVFTVGGAPGTPPPDSYAGDRQGDREWEDYSQHADENLTIRFSAKAGPGVVGVAFVQARSVRDGVLQPRASGKLLAVHEKWSSPSEAPEAAVDSVVVTGPYNASGPGDTPSRRRIFQCRPGGSLGEEACATRILSTIARRAYRRPVAREDVATLVAFYKEGRRDGGFEGGIRRGVESILLDPEFLFRVERDPAGVAPQTAYRVSDLELASRLSFFLWSSIPDDELLAAAERRELSDPAVLERQVRRMLADARAKSLVANFASQWLSLRKLRNVGPTPELFVDFDDNLREAFQQETELFLESQLRADVSVLELLEANYTFLNERLARHYGIPGVYGSRFRRVALDGETRGGLLTQGSILTLTSYPNRTSPVLRGHWVLQNIVGAPPPPPPPDIPGLPERGDGVKPTSVRERLEQHRANPVCATCHSQMDPLGFALEHFDAIGKWRGTGEAGGAINASGITPDGVKFNGIDGLKSVLLRNREQFPTAFTEKLLTYALGRGLEYYDMPAVRGVVRSAARNDYRWSSIILGIVSSQPFQMRRSDS